MKFRSDLEALILGALAEGSKHGYAIVRSIRQKSEGVLSMGEGQLYPVLHRLEEEGHISAFWQESEPGRPPKKIYSLTESGLRELSKRREEWRQFSSGVASVIGLSLPEKGVA